MARDRDPKYQYIVRIHVSHGHAYASSRKLYTSEKDGKTKITDVYLGTLEELPEGSDYKYRFHPNSTFILLDAKERKKYIFPSDWDISEKKKVDDMADASKDEIIHAIDESYLYGDILLMNKIAEDTQMISHLSKVFDGNEIYIQDTLTLAYHMFLTKHSWNRVEKWQKIEKTPTPITKRILNASYITKFTQSLTEENRSDLIRLRIGMVKEEDLVCIDSTTRSGYGGKRLCEIDFGHNKDDKDLPCSTEVMAYSMNTHMPIYYQTFAGNMVDIRTTELVLEELRAFGFKNNVVTCTDRGYFCRDEIDWHILHNIPLITFVKIDSSLVSHWIPDIGYSGEPFGMKLDEQENIYYGQYEEEYSFTDENGEKHTAILTVNLYYNPLFRPEKQMKLNKLIRAETEQLAPIMAARKYLSDDEVKRFKYHTIKRDKDTKEVLEFSANETKIRRKQKTFGFTAIITYGLKDFGAMPTLKTYRLRGEQEECFEIMKEENGMDKHDCWSEDGIYGRRFITFVGNTLISYARSKWRNEQELYDAFDSTADMFDTMRPIKWISHPGMNKHLTPLVGDQVLIADKFDLDIPDYCLPNKDRKNVTDLLRCPLIDLSKCPCIA